jgi:predicted glycoside hydrolase/deacetylase ChbG (UPF0249 family)
MTGGTRIWLVADDYGIAPAVNGAIRDLLTRGRINATSVMVVGPACGPDEVRALAEIKAQGSGKKPAIGLHLTLTAPFKPLSEGYPLTSREAFLPLGRTAAAALRGRIDAQAVAREVRAQIDAFKIMFGRAPDYIDGHQHVHLLSPISESVLAQARELAPNIWVRQCARTARGRSIAPKALLLDLASYAFRRRAAAHGIRTNPAFAGAYEFRTDVRFADLFPKFLVGMRDGGVIMCHPGVVDTTLVELDPLTTLREREYEYFKSDGFPAALAAHGIALA